MYDVGLSRFNCVQCWIIKGSTVYNVGLSQAQLSIMLDYQVLNCVQCWIIKGSLPIRAQHDHTGTQNGVCIKGSSPICVPTI